MMISQFVLKALFSGVRFTLSFVVRCFRIGLFYNLMTIIIEKHYFTICGLAY